MKNIILILTMTLFISLNIAHSSENNVAKVILMKGDVTGTMVDGTKFSLNLDQNIKEGTVIQTEEKSFVKLLFIDKSQMNLGPKSQMVINAFPQKDPGIITLVKGQLRSKVTKDYMEMEDKEKSKLYIKTSSAAMGVRGTDFQVNFNEVNHNTALITFEGAVAMVNITKAEAGNRFDQKQLEKAVSSDKAVMVKEGQISAVNLNVSELAMVPTKLSKTQITALKDNETGLKVSTDNAGDSSKKAFRSPIPPGIDGAILSATPKSSDTRSDSVTKAANGFFNQKTGEYKLPAGSIVDLNSVNIIPPPVNAVFDANSKMYVVPSTFGKIDPTTGEYKAPEGLKLGTDGKFHDAPKEKKDDKPAPAPLAAPAAAAPTSTVAPTAQVAPPPAAPAAPATTDSTNNNPTSAAAAAPVTAAPPPPPAEVANNTQASAPPPIIGPSPASVAPADIAAPAKSSNAPASIFDAQPAMTQFAATFAAPVAPPIVDANRAPPPPPPSPISNTLQSIANDRITTTNTVNNNNVNLGVKNPTTNVHFILNVH